MADEKEYPDNVLEGFRNGCLLDLRVRLAVEFLKGPMFRMAFVEHEPVDIAVCALQIADELLNYAENCGWITPLPTESEIGPALRLQAKLTAQFNALQQIEGQKAMQDEVGKVVPVSPGVMRTVN